MSLFYNNKNGMPTVIELQHVAKHYQAGSRCHPVFTDLNVSIRTGEFLVLLGKSGCGKSTLLNLISGLDAPDRGEVIVKDTPLNRLDERARTLFRRRYIGFVFQEFNLVKTLTVKDNLLLPLELNGFSHSEAADRVLQMLERLAISDKAEDFPEQLSGGEQQRVAIARALVHGPEVVLADEPTGNLDLETGRQVLALLDRSVREAGKTLVMVTHSREVIGVADRVLNIEGGKLVQVRDER